MAPKGSKTVPIKGSTEKRMIATTFTITLDGHFLPVQLIHGGKTSKSLPTVNFPKSFSLSANPKHYSNEQESIKVLEEIIIPYVKKDRKRLGMEKDQAALLIMDVFKGQMTSPVLKVLSNNNILLQSVPANFTYLFQPLDVQEGPNGFVKTLMKRKFTDWHASQIILTMEEGKELETMEVPLKLCNIKTLHAKWLTEMCNEMTSDKSRKVCLKRWEVSGIKAAAEQGLSKLPCLYRFSDMDPMVENDCDMQSINARVISEASKYVSEYECDEGTENNSDCEEWIDENQQDDDQRNVFDLFHDEEGL